MSGIGIRPLLQTQSTKPLCISSGDLVFIPPNFYPLQSRTPSHNDLIPSRSFEQITGLPAGIRSFHVPNQRSSMLSYGCVFGEIIPIFQCKQLVVCGSHHSISWLQGFPERHSRVTIGMILCETLCQVPSSIACRYFDRKHIRSSDGNYERG